jgi:hypothetical protein
VNETSNSQAPVRAAWRTTSSSPTGALNARCFVTKAIGARPATAATGLEEGNEATEKQNPNNDKAYALTPTGLRRFCAYFGFISPAKPRLYGKQA